MIILIIEIIEIHVCILQRYTANVDSIIFVITRLKVSRVFCKSASLVSPPSNGKSYR
jgi:hypothetical protein